MNKTKIIDATVSFISDPTMNKINLILVLTDGKTVLEASGFVSKIPGTLKVGGNSYICLLFDSISLLNELI
jgi:hypothetical protein